MGRVRSTLNPCISHLVPRTWPRQRLALAGRWPYHSRL